MPTTSFVAAEHSFRFSNGEYTADMNRGVLPFWFPWKNVVASGRCGGMVYAALDYHFYGMPIPQTETVPPNDHEVSKFILQRLLDTWWSAGAEFSVNTFSPTKRVHHVSRHAIAVAKQRVDRGDPSPMGLSRAKRLRDLGDDHQILVIGYDVLTSGATALQIYDPNAPREQRTLTVDVDGSVEAYNDHTWRGVLSYRWKPKRPPIAG